MPVPAFLRLILARIMPARSQKPANGIDPKTMLDELISTDGNTRVVILQRADRLYKVLYQCLVRETLPESVGETTYWKDLQIPSLTDSLENAYDLARNFIGGALSEREDWG